MDKKTVRDVHVRGGRVLVRADFNVPLDKATGTVGDTRLRATMPTIEYLREHGAKIILCSHLDRPGGKVVEGLRMAPVAKRLSELLGTPVRSVRDCVGQEVEDAVWELKEGDILLLENLRFHPEEEADDPNFARALASLADLFVNDAFGAAHRAHASTVGVAIYLPAVAGLLMEKEIDSLTKVTANPERPFAALLGGAKISSKMGVINNLIKKLDMLLIGGGMACTFLKAKGLEVGESTVGEEQVPLAAHLMELISKNGTKLFLPTDVVIADAFSADAHYKTVPVDKIEPGWRIMDIGPETVKLFSAQLEKCKMVFWNGPMGVFEFPAFAEGTKAMARELAHLKAITIAGGGETLAAVEEEGLMDKMTHVSTGGGASLEFLEGKVLPGVAALQDK
ncbi:MAG: phosphoglycerate kinase [Chloroflexi bacterium]|nr:phosphoglycerate kinase [Chloroflexota bacterium]